MGDHTMIIFSLPDEEVQAALGRVAITHGHLEYILKMTIKSLSGRSIEDALNSTNKKQASTLRQLIEKEAKDKLGQCTELEQLLDFIGRAWKASDKRNQFIHNLWARELDGPLLFQNDGCTRCPAPTKEELDILSQEISAITSELNESRLRGTIFEAINHKV